MRRTALLLVVLGAFGCGGGGGTVAGPPSGNPPPGSPPPGSPPPVEPPPGGGGTPQAIQVGAFAFTAVGGEATCQGPSGGGKGSGTGPLYRLAWADLIALAQPGICGYLQANQQKASAQMVTIRLVRVDRTKSATSLTTGTYPIVSPTISDTTYASLLVEQTDATCTATSLVALSGTIVVTSVAGGRIQGTVVATLAGGATVDGTFDATPCAVTLPGDACSGNVGPQNMTCAP